MPKVVEHAIRRCVNGGETIKSVEEDINDLEVRYQGVSVIYITISS